MVLYKTPYNVFIILFHHGAVETVKKKHQSEMWESLF